MSEKVLFFGVVGSGDLSVAAVLNQIITRKAERDEQEPGLVDQVKVEVAMFESEGDMRAHLSNGFAGHTQVVVYESKVGQSFIWHGVRRPRKQAPEWATGIRWVVEIGNLSETRVKNCANELLADMIAWVTRPGLRDYPWGQAKKPKGERGSSRRRRGPRAFRYTGNFHTW